VEKPLHLGFFTLVVFEQYEWRIVEEESENNSNNYNNNNDKDNNNNGREWRKMTDSIDLESLNSR